MGVARAIAPLVEGTADTGPEDEAWYWAAPILLDQRADPSAAHRWWADKALALNWLGAEEEDERESEDAENDNVIEGAAGWKRHVAEASQMLANPRTKLGRPPADLAEVVAQMALAGPAVTALRAIARITGGAETATDPLRRHMAGKVAFGFRSLFNAARITPVPRNCEL